MTIEIEKKEIVDMSLLIEGLKRNNGQVNLEELNRLQGYIEELINQAKQNEPELVKRLREAGIEIKIKKEQLGYPEDRNMI